MKWTRLKSEVSPTFVKCVWITCLICFTFLMCGSARTFSAFLISQFTQGKSVIKITENEASWLGCLSSLFNPVGFLLGGYTMDAFGRKWSTKFVFLPFIMGWGLIMCAKNLEAFYIGISLHGIASGMTMIASVYVSEVSSPEYRGFLLSVLGVTYMFGVLMCSVIHYFVCWRYTASYFFVMSIVMYLMMNLIPESPYWLILKGRAEDASEVLKQMRHDRDAVKEEVLEIERGMNTNTSTKLGTLKSLLAAWKQMAILTTFAVLHKLTGFTPLAQYTVTFFQKLEIPVDGRVASIIHSMVCFLSTFAVPYFVHSYRRRALLFVTSTMAGLSMIVTLVYESVYYNSNVKPYFWTPLVGIYAYDVATTIGITSISIMLPGELLPTEISGIACAVFSITSGVITTVISKTYLTVFASVGLVTMLGVFTFCCFFIAALSIIILPETRNKTLREIQETYFSKSVAEKTKISVTANVAVLELDLGVHI